MQAEMKAYFGMFIFRNMADFQHYRANARERKGSAFELAWLHCKKVQKVLYKAKIRVGREKIRVENEWVFLLCDKKCFRHE
jgi:hypothetical protein